MSMADGLEWVDAVFGVVAEAASMVEVLVGGGGTADA